MMTLAEATERQATWDTVRLVDVLARLSSRLDITAAMIAKIEASLGILIHDAKGLSPELIKDLQEIDLARQSIGDVGRVLRLVSGLNTAITVNGAAIASVIHLRDLADHLVFGRPNQTVAPDPETDSISWF